MVGSNFNFGLIILTFFKLSSARDYCSIDTCSDPHLHTMCMSKGPEPQCPTYGVGLTGGEKKLIVDKHNELRAKVASGNESQGSPGPQPAAKNMQNLTWDDELATIAQRSANTCVFQHDQCRDVERFQVGQNIASESSTESGYSPDVTTFVQMWYDEVKLFDSNQVSKYNSDGRTGHYTQLVWAKTTNIGCGSVKYNQDGYNNVYLVCNYGPAGNFIGQEMYQIKE